MKSILKRFAVGLAVGVVFAAVGGYMLYTAVNL